MRGTDYPNSCEGVKGEFFTAEAQGRRRTNFSPRRRKGGAEKKRRKNGFDLLSILICSSVPNLAAAVKKIISAPPLRLRVSAVIIPPHEYSPKKILLLKP